MKNYKSKFCVICGKEFFPNSGAQKYCVECRIIVHREQVKKWHQVNRERAKAHSKKYYQSIKGKQAQKKYFQSIEGKQANKKYYQSIKGKQVNKKYDQSIKGEQLARKVRSSRRDMGFNPWNKPFKGCVAHHLDKENVIYIPEWMHQSIRHCLKTGKNMDQINDLAIAYLEKFFGR
jgi:hypothetical protein